MKRRELIVVGLIAAISLCGCHMKDNNFLSERKMIAVMVDMEVGEAYIQQYIPDGEEKLRGEIYAGILKKNGVTQAQFDSTLTAYGKNMDKYEELYKSVDKELEKRQKKITGQAANVAQALNDIWPYSKYALIDSRSEAEGVNFSFTPEALDKGSRLEWSMRMSNVPEGEIMLGVEYEQGPDSYVSQTLYGNNKAGITLQTDSSRDVRRIFGYLVLNQSRNINIQLDSISLTHQPLDSVQYFRYRGQRRFQQPHIFN